MPSIEASSVEDFKGSQPKFNFNPSEVAASESLLAAKVKKGGHHLHNPTLSADQGFAGVSF